MELIKKSEKIKRAKCALARNKKRLQAFEPKAKEIFEKKIRKLSPKNLESNFTPPEIVSMGINSDILVYNPEIDFFMDRIDEKFYFSYTRQLHGFWDGIIGALHNNPELRDINLSKTYIKLLAKEITKFKEEEQGFFYEDFIYKDVLNMVISIDRWPKNFLLGVNDLGFYQETQSPVVIKNKSYDIWDTHMYKPGRIGPQSIKAYELRQILIQKFLPKDHIPFEGMLWRRFAFHNKLKDFFLKYKKRKIVIVGPNYYTDFRKLFNLEKYSHVEIDISKASWQAYTLANRIFDEHFHHLKTNDSVIYFISAGTLGTWLTLKLHNLPNSFILDVGRALEYFYPTKAKGRWLKI